jgi:hypothetical protein
MRAKRSCHRLRLPSSSTIQNDPLKPPTSSAGTTVPRLPTLVIDGDQPANPPHAYAPGRLSWAQWDRTCRLHREPHRRHGRTRRPQRYGRPGGRSAPAWSRKQCSGRSESDSLLSRRCRCCLRGERSECCPLVCRRCAVAHRARADKPSGGTRCGACLRGELRGPQWPSRRYLSFASTMSSFHPLSLFVSAGLALPFPRGGASDCFGDGSMELVLSGIIAAHLALPVVVLTAARVQLAVHAAASLRIMPSLLNR